MNKKKIYNYFTSKFDLSQSTGGWYRMPNPLHKTKGVSMAVNFQKNVVLCHSKGYKFSLSDFIKKVEHLDYSGVKDLIGHYAEIQFRVSIPLSLHTKKTTLPKGFHLLSEKVPFQDRAIKFLKEKNLDIDFLDSLGFGFCSSGEWVGRIIIPFINKGSLVYYIGRSFIGADPKYKNPKKEDVGIGKSEIFYNEDNLSEEEIFLTEGAFDSLSCPPGGVASLGWKLSKVQFSKIISAPCKRVSIVPDRGFYHKALKLAYQLMEHKEVWISNLDGSEFGDVNESGFDFLTFKRVDANLLREEVLKNNK